MSVLNNIIWSPKEYREAAFIAREAGDEMLSRLDWMTIQPKIVLDIGCGIGESSVSLQDRYPSAIILPIDMSLSMVQYAKQNTLLTHCVCAAGESLPLQDHSVDLIFANFFLSWQIDMQTILKEWKRVLSPQGLLIVTALGLDTLREYREIIDRKHVPNYVDMHDLGDALLHVGFCDPVLDVQHYEAAYADPERLLAELLASGLWCPENEKEAAQVKSQLLANDRMQSVTYEVIHAHAFTQQSDVKKGLNTVHVSLSDIKWKKS